MVTAPDWGDGPTGGRRRGLLSRRLYVQAIIWFTVLFVLGMTVLIWHRWSSVALPTANIIPLGDEKANPGARALQAKLARGRGGLCRPDLVCRGACHGSEPI